MLKCRLPTSKTPLLDRRGDETDERSEFGEAGWWTADSQGPCHPERSEGSPPPRPLSRHLRRLARVHPSCPGGESCVCYSLHTFVSTHKNVITFFLGSPYKPFRMTGFIECWNSTTPPRQIRFAHLSRHPSCPGGH
jgi:hypothetical protein